MPASDPSDQLRRFGVRCFFTHATVHYEERVTLWRARDFGHAIELAEAEALDYCADVTEPSSPTVYLGLAQAYELDDDPAEQGAEVFSLIRDSALAPSEYLVRFFNTGDEREGSLGA